MLAESVSVKQQILNVINIILHEDEYLGKTIDAIFELPIAHQEAVIAFFMEEIGQEDWEELTEDETLYPEFFKALIMFFSGREEIKKEPDRLQLTELFQAYLESKHCHDIVDEDSREELAEMMGEMV